MIKAMETINKEILLKDLCARLPYRVKVCFKYDILMGETTEELTPSLIEKFNNLSGKLYQLKPYLRPMSSMTKEEAKTLVTLWGIEDFISLDITEEYIGVVCDDGFSSTATTEIWYDGDMPIECYDFLNAHHLDYRGLVPMDLALKAPEGMYDFK